MTDRDLVVRTTCADGSSHRVERFRERRVPRSRIEARAPDPDAGTPYGLLVWRDPGFLHPDVQELTIRTPRSERHPLAGP